MKVEHKLISKIIQAVGGSGSAGYKQVLASYNKQEQHKLVQVISRSARPQ